LTETGSYPLGDSSVPNALRYATGATHRIIGNGSFDGPQLSDDRGIEVKQ